MHTVLPSPSVQSGISYLRKEVEVSDSGSWHHPCGKKGALPKRRGPRKDVWSQKETQMAVAPRFKFHRQSPSAAPFLAPPTTGHSCQHSGQVWPCGVEPIISKFFWIPLQISIWGPPLGCTLLQHDYAFAKIHRTIH